MNNFYIKDIRCIYRIKETLPKTIILKDVLFHNIRKMKVRKNKGKKIILLLFVEILSEMG